MMSAQEVVQAAAVFHPRVPVPVHWLETERLDVDYITTHAPSGTTMRILEAR
jgi:L-ascorbate metabolism protein UlaG (beta-lactamase superfamily)